MSKTTELEEENKVLRRTLKYYADKGNWVIWNGMAISTTEMERDKGERARKVLGDKN